MIEFTVMEKIYNKFIGETYEKVLYNRFCFISFTRNSTFSLHSILLQFAVNCCNVVYWYRPFTNFSRIHESFGNKS